MSLALDRRMFMAGLTGLGATTALQPAIAKRQKKMFEKLNRPIGLQLYTLGDEPSKDLAGTLAKVALIGYSDLELPQLYGKTPAELKAAANAVGVSFSCIHLAATPNTPKTALSLMSDTQRIVDDLGALGVKSAVLPIMLFPDNFTRAENETFQAALARSLFAAGEDIWKRTADLLNEKAQALKPHGISVGYHNHNVEFQAIGKTNGWEILAKETDKKLVSFEVDVGWLAAAGVDPVAFFKRYSGRCRQMHVKDVKPTTKTNYALSMDPTEIGSGKLDWKRILPAAQKAGVRNFYVEQEPPFSATRMEAVEKSYAFLSTLRA